MSRKCLSILGACLAVFALGAISVGQAAASTMEDVTAKAALLAVYGNPPERAVAGEPIGGGLGRNFGFGENMLFEANTAEAIGKNLTITIGGGALEANETFVGGTLTSNKTPEITVGEVKHQSPVSFAIEFIDFQDATPAASFADTYDRHSIGEMCGAKATCKVGPREGEEGARLVKFENISFNVGPGTVVQGTIWGTWINGTATTPPCIELREPPEKASFETLYETQGAAVGAKSEKTKGEVCLISANNNWYTVSSTVKLHDAITLE